MNDQLEKDFQVNQSYHGFLLLQKDYLEHSGITLLQFQYEKTKTLLFALKNSDSNKCFCIGFPTLPTNSKGIPHIIEHSVLSGSHKYPVKDVFSELTKGSLHTFLNAMTYSDKTLYPFATCNQEEYFNLMDVYLDLVLNPLLKKETFLQEGWHHAIESPQETVSYNGIVYNEMKGAYSNPVSVLYENTMQALMPNSTYSHNSGGNPSDIVKLSYEEFVDFYKKNYHPSHAKIFLYGNAPLEEELETIHNSHLSKFHCNDMQSAIDVKNNSQKIAFF